MFSNILNSAKNAMDSLAEAAQQQQQQQQQEQPIQPPPPQQPQQQGENKDFRRKHSLGSGGNDFLSGLMNAAQEVGKAIGDKSQEGAQAVKSGATTVSDTTKTTAEGAGRMTKEEIDRLASGIGDIVGKVAGSFSHKPADVEEEVTSIDSKGGKVQVSSVQDEPLQDTKPKEQGGDFLSNLVGVAKQVGQAIGERSQEGAQAVKTGASNVADSTKTTAEGAGKFTKEEIEKITSGIGDLVGKAAGAFGHKSAGDVEEEVGKIDSQGGKVQVSSVQDASADTKPKQKGDFFAGLVDVAKQVGQAIGDKSQEGAQAVKTGAGNVADSTKSTAEGAGKLTKEELDKISAGISDLMGKAAGALHIGEKKKEGSPEATQTKTETKEEAKPAEGDFLSGLMGMAKEVGKSMGDKMKQPEGEDFSASKPVVDDVEEEIGKVITAGTTSEKAVQPSK